jgi:hypothetical protein
VNPMTRPIIALATTCAEGVLALPVKLQPAVRALTADALSFGPKNLSGIDTIDPVRKQKVC